MVSVPPRGSGGSVAFMLNQPISLQEPTRYREVVLTSWARGNRNLNRNPDLRMHQYSRYWQLAASTPLG
jgi:hypothetical protein